MEKRLTRSDYLFIFVFIFMLVAAVGAFFYGVQIGRHEMQTQYAKLHPGDDAVKKQPSAYEQQVLVSFYHTIYSPFREFQNKWSADMEAIAAPDATTDVKSLLKGLQRLANEKYSAIQHITLPQNSPLLLDAQTGYMKSLRLFASGADRLLEKQADDGIKWADAVRNDSYITEAKRFALHSQLQFYDAIVLWNETVDPTLTPVDAKSGLSLNLWEKLNLNEKNRYLAAWLSENMVFANFYPQDLAIDIDDMIAKGNAKKMRLSTVDDIAATLVNSAGVRAGDFNNGKAKYYRNERLPQLPFFID
ncbi:MAG TPA: hypothetical protein VF260_10460 [Bacilli bacterium]